MVWLCFEKGEGMMAGRVMHSNVFVMDFAESIGRGVGRQESGG